MNSQEVTVVMSTYNGERYLKEQLESILCQKIDELIIIDDASRDKTVEIIKEYIKKYNFEDKTRLIQNKSNKGWKYNFIYGAKIAKGKLVFFSDQDDIWYRNKIDIYKKIFANDSNINVVASKEIIWDGDEKKINENSLLVASQEFNRIMLTNVRNYLIQCSGCTMAVRKKYFDSVVKFYTDDWAHDDFLWKMATLDNSFALLTSSTILHRIHGNNESRRKRNLKKTIQGFEIENRIINSMLDRLDTSEDIVDNDLKKKIIIHEKKGNNLRKKFFETGSVLSILKIFLFYQNIYRRRRQFIGDIVIKLKEKKR